MSAIAFPTFAINENNTGNGQPPQNTGSSRERR